MNLLRRTVLVGMTAAVSLSSLQAKAYDEDTHFYGTYSMARFAGIRHEVAAKLALSAQWMDESFISDPTSMIFLPVSGVKKRRLLHFPSSRVSGRLNARAQSSMVNLEKPGFLSTVMRKVVDYVGYEGEVKLGEVNIMTETEEGHPFATQMLMEGLKEGNLMKAGASLHVLEDSYAHAGTSAEEGHRAFWHWPDRPYASIAKYHRMVRNVFNALVAIRTQLPADALDCTVRIQANVSAEVASPNCVMNAAALAKNYSGLPEVQRTVSYNVMKDPEYVAFALENLIRLAADEKKLGGEPYLFITEDRIKPLIASLKLDGKTDAYEALEKLIMELLRQRLHGIENTINLKHILDDMGHLSKDSTVDILDYIDSYGSDPESIANMTPDGFKNFVHVIAHELLKWHVPAPLSDAHRIEFEDDTSPTFRKEIEIRVRNMQALIEKLYGTKIQMIGNNTKDQAGFGKELRMDPSAETPVEIKDPLVSYITFTLKEKHQWARMIFGYLFPTLKFEVLLKVSEVIRQATELQPRIDEYVRKRKAINDSNSYWAAKKSKLLYLDYQYSDVAGDMFEVAEKVLNDLRPHIKSYIKDLMETHMVPDEDHFFFKNTRLFCQYKANDVVKPLLTSADAWTLESLKVGSQSTAQWSRTCPAAKQTTP
jgi:hypothetical protein